MPTDYCCDSCHLQFSLGWYHHSLDFYPSSTLLACRGCGHSYCVYHEDIYTPDRLFANPEPCHSSAEDFSTCGLFGLSIAEVECTPAFDLRDRSDQSLLCVPHPSAEMLRRVRCIACNRTGSIVKDWPELSALHMNPLRRSAQLGKRVHELLEDWPLEVEGSYTERWRRRIRRGLRACKYRLADLRWCATQPRANGAHCPSCGKRELRIVAEWCT